MRKNVYKSLDLTIKTTKSKTTSVCGIKKINISKNVILAKHPNIQIPTKNGVTVDKSNQPNQNIEKKYQQNVKLVSCKSPNDLIDFLRLL